MALPRARINSDVEGILGLTTHWMECNTKSLLQPQVTSFPILLSVALTNQSKILPAVPGLVYPTPTPLGVQTWRLYLAAEGAPARKSLTTATARHWLSRLHHLLPPNREITRKELWWLMLCTTSPLAGFYNWPTAMFVSRIRSMAWGTEAASKPTAEVTAARPVTTRRRLC